jgi:hypothetical protein
MSDVLKQKNFVRNKRNSQTKAVKRSTRARMHKLETVFVTLIGELRSALQQISDKHEEQTLVTVLLARAQQGQELTEDDASVLQDYLKTYEVKPEAPNDAVAGPGSDVQPGV